MYGIALWSLADNARLISKASRQIDGGLLDVVSIAMIALLVTQILSAGGAGLALMLERRSGIGLGAVALVVNATDPRIWAVIAIASVALWLAVPHLSSSTRPGRAGKRGASALAWKIAFGSSVLMTVVMTVILVGSLFLMKEARGGQGFEGFILPFLAFGAFAIGLISLAVCVGSAVAIRVSATPAVRKNRITLRG